MVLYVYSSNVDPLDTRAGRVDALATMSLIQMMADAYKTARVGWQKDIDNAIVEGVDDPESFGPNEAQKAIDDWLVHTGFLPSKPPRKRTRESNFVSASIYDF
ncbi:hypothetical protein BDZ97DRAFT_1919925 [Flammula alnicola]|nr:hypothetical protein BDZ97DRAFT_1919925 [Flammula alnicola]